MSTDAEPGGCECGPPHCKAVVAAGTKTDAGARMALLTLAATQGTLGTVPDRGGGGGEGGGGTP